MKLRRFISKEELDVLVREGEVKPIKNMCYFFDVNESHCFDVDYQIEYVSGVVGMIDNKERSMYIVLDISLPKKSLKPKLMSWADPYGSFFDTILVNEFRNKTGYKLFDVKKVTVWGKDYGTDSCYTIRKTGTVQEVRDWIEECLTKDN